MAPPKSPPKMPWEKECAELTKYDWSIAVGWHKAHKNHPLDLRVANVLMQKADTGTCLMWATQQTIAKLAGVADERQVRTAMARMEESGAIFKKRIADLQPDTWASLQEKMSGNRNKRGVIYTLRLFWAYETFERLTKASSVEPSHLQNSREEHRTTIVRQHRTTIVRSGQDYDSPPYTTVGNYTDTDGAYEGRKPIKVSSAPLEEVGDLLPAPSPDHADAVLAELLHGIEPPAAVEAFFRQELIAGRLRRSVISNWLRVAA